MIVDRCETSCSSAPFTFMASFLSFDLVCAGSAVKIMFKKVEHKEN